MKRWIDHERFAVLGLGKSGVAAANLLARRGKRVVVSDDNPDADTEALHRDVDVELGQTLFQGAEIVVVSPGFKPSLEVFSHVEVPFISEIELAWDVAEAPMIGITGTDGKTTTTSLTAHMLDHAGTHAVAAGNIGTPLCDVVDDVPTDGVIVAEVSAFQLWTTHRFRVRAAAFTNIAEDHLDYFGEFSDYVEAKHRLVANCREGDLGVFNFDDPVVRKWAQDFPYRRAVYATRQLPQIPAELTAWFDDAGRYLVLAEDGEEPVHVSRSDLDRVGLRGPHNYANFMAAAALARDRGASWGDILGATDTFEPHAHRLQFVDEIDGVEFYDDSKATNAHAALAGIRSLAGELVVIAGGVDKGLDLTELAAELTTRCPAVVLIGELRERLHGVLMAAGMDNDAIDEATDMDDAVDRAFERAKKAGATVLLSPACSSFDMFDSYAHRGDVFQRAVGALA